MELPAGPGGRAILATSRDQGGSVPLLTASFASTHKSRSRLIKGPPNLPALCREQRATSVADDGKRRMLQMDSNTVNFLFSSTFTLFASLAHLPHLFSFLQQQNSNTETRHPKVRNRMTASELDLHIRTCHLQSFNKIPLLPITDFHTGVKLAIYVALIDNVFRSTLSSRRSRLYLYPKPPCPLAGL